MSTSFSEDKYTGKSFEHRRQWMVERIRYLTEVFAIEVCAYAIMSNHYHLVLFVNEDVLAHHQGGTPVTFALQKA